MINLYIRLIGCFLLLTFLFFGRSPLCAQGFTDVSLDAGIDFLVDEQSYMGGGAAFFDYDNDGLLDIYITGGEDLDRLYKNEGDGTFSNQTLAAGFDSTSTFFSHGVTTGDIDNDGFREIFITSWDYNFQSAYARNYLYYNNGDGTFSDITTSAGMHLDSAWSTSATFGDFNLDGYLDLYVTNYVEQVGFIRDTAGNGNINGFAHICFPDLLYFNNGDNTFTNKSIDYDITDLGCGLAVAATNYNNDDHIDIMLANDFGEFIVPNKLYQGPDLTEVSATTGTDIGLYGMGIAIGDYDEDDDLDYYISNLGRNVLLQNQGDGTFIDNTTFAGIENTAVDTLLVTSWGTAFFDYDNDTYLDLFVNNGFIPAADFIATTYTDPNKLYRNNGDGTFSDLADSLGLGDVNVGRGFAQADYDNDGDLDMIIVNLNRFVTMDPHVTLYRNDLNNGSNYIKFELTGVLANRDAFGAHLRVHADGRTFLREVGGGSSHASQNTSIVHVGLGVIDMVDSVSVQWPGGRTQKLCSNLSINTLHQILEDTSALMAAPCFDPSTSVVGLSFEGLGLTTVPNPFTRNTAIQYRLREAASVRLSVQDVLGREVALLQEENLQAGAQSVLFSPGEYGVFESGVYFYSLRVNGQVFTRKMVLSR